MGKGEGRRHQINKWRECGERMTGSDVTEWKGKEKNSREKEREGDVKQRKGKGDGRGREVDKQGLRRMREGRQ